MKKIIILIILLGLSFTFTLKTFADVQTTQETSPTLPQSESESKDKQITQPIASPQFYSEDSIRTFIKGVGVGFAVGIIIGGVIVWFYKRKLT